MVFLGNLKTQKIIGGVFTSAFVFLSIFFLWVLSPEIFSQENIQANISEAVATNLPITETVPLIPEPEPNISIPKDSEIQALAALSVEFSPLGEKVLFSQNPSEHLAAASLTKLMTALVVMKRYDLNQEVVISDRALQEIGEQGDLKKGDVLSVKNLLYVMLIESSNRAAYALGEVLGIDGFVGLMNDEAQELGLINTHFVDNTGLADRGYSTTFDIAHLSSHLVSHYPLFNEIVRHKQFALYLPNGKLHHTLINTNELLETERIIGGKTGYTVAAGGCFMTIQYEYPGAVIINVILGSRDRSEAMKSLIKKSNGVTD